MRIWHKKLIPHLCRNHLLAVWRDSLGAYAIITQNKRGYHNHPAVKEFEYCPEILYGRLYIIRLEMIKRGYHPKEMPPIHKSSSVGITEKELLIKEWQTLEEQIEILGGKKCRCEVDKIKI